jgi:two-component system sensor kinase FixL
MSANPQHRGAEPAVSAPPEFTTADSPDQPTSRLLEQLMQVARVSALEEMASGFAHELNQPIGAIATFAQAAERMLARPDPSIASALEVLRYISTEALNAGHGIRKIRSLFNRSDTPRAICQLPDVLGELLPALRLLARRHNVEVQTAVAGSLPDVSIDRLRIQHVLFVLVQNALEAPARYDATPSVRIEIASDRYAVLASVTDCGIGIGADAREQLFRPFFTTKPQGTGLGLASSRAIIEAHEGKIGYENTAGGGARFWFTLPAAASGVPTA